MSSLLFVFGPFSATFPRVMGKSCIHVFAICSQLSVDRPLSYPLPPYPGDFGTNHSMSWWCTRSQQFWITKTFRWFYQYLAYRWKIRLYFGRSLPDDGNSKLLFRCFWRALWALYQLHHSRPWGCSSIFLQAGWVHHLWPGCAWIPTPRRQPSNRQKWFVTTSLFFCSFFRNLDHIYHEAPHQKCYWFTRNPPWISSADFVLIYVWSLIFCWCPRLNLWILSWQFFVYWLLGWIWARLLARVWFGSLFPSSFWYCGFPLCRSCHRGCA